MYFILCNETKSTKYKKTKKTKTGTNFKSIYIARDRKSKYSRPPEMSGKFIFRIR